MNAIDHAHAHLSGEHTAQEEAEYARLLASSQEHVDALDEAKQIRALLAEARTEAESLASARPFQFPEDARQPLVRWWIPTGAFAAALVVLLTWMAPTAPQHSIRGPQPTPPQRATSPLILADGSLLEVGEGTRLEHLQGRMDAIEIRLHGGELTADVVPAESSHRAFLVHAGATTVRVLGTRFTVRWDGTESVEVSVTKGRVLVTSPDGSMELSNRESATFPAVAPPVIETPVAESMDRPAPVAEPRETEEPVARKNAQRRRVTARADRARPQAPSTPPAQTGISSASPAPQAPPAASPAPPGATVEVIQAPDPRTLELASMIGSIRERGCVSMLPRIEAFMRANASHRRAVDALYLRGYCLYRMGNQEEAIRAWKKVERRQPSSPWLRTVRDWTQPGLPDVSRLR